MSDGAAILHVATLAKGGMGRVDVALMREGPIERLCAVKRLHAHFAEDEELVRMFEEEARLSALLQHPNVVSVWSASVDEDGPRLVMEYVEGVSASELVRSHIEDGVRVPVGLAIEIARQTAVALRAAHELRDARNQPVRLIHRDVSPQNILVGREGVVRLADFGIAKALESASTTRTGFLKGKKGYMAPEQLRFEPPDERTDLFSLGIVLFELLATRRLYRGDLAATAKEILYDPVPDIIDHREDAPPEVAELLFELLAKDRVDRPGSAAEVAARLERIGQGLVDPGPRLADVVDARFGGAFEERRQQFAEALAALRREPRHRVLRWALAVAAVTAMLGTSAFLWLEGPAPSVSAEKAAEGAVEEEAVPTPPPTAATPPPEAEASAPAEADEPSPDPEEPEETAVRAARRGKSRGRADTRGPGLLGW